MKRHDDEFEHTEDYAEHRDNATGSVLIGMLVGGLIGAVTALLYAPRSGDETRAEIRNKAIELRDRTTETFNDTVSQAKSKAYELLDTVSEEAQELKQRGKHTIDEQLDRVSRTAERGKQKIQE